MTRRPTKRKACKILQDGMIGGKKLTAKQRRFFGVSCYDSKNKGK